MSNHSFFSFFSIVFYRPPPLSIFHPPLNFSYPSSCSHPISAVTFPFSCVLDVFLNLSYLSSLPASILARGQPISCCFSLIFLLGCIAYQLLSSGRSSFVCPPSLFMLFDEPSCSHKLLFLLFCQRPCLQTFRHARVTQALKTFSFRFFEILSIQHDSLYLLQPFAPACIRSRTSTSECPSSVANPLMYTKRSTCLIYLPSNLMFISSL